MLGAPRYAAWRPLARGLGEIVLHFARGPASVMAARQHSQSGGGTDLPHPGLDDRADQRQRHLHQRCDRPQHDVRVDKNKDGDGQAQADVLRF
jgi:hypothetical protein